MHILLVACSASWPLKGTRLLLFTWAASSGSGCHLAFEVTLEHQPCGGCCDQAGWPPGLLLHHGMDAQGGLVQPPAEQCVLLAGTLHITYA